MSSTETTFTSKLKTKRELIDQALEQYFTDADTSKFSRHGEEAWDMIEDFTMRPGKRIRGSLVLVAYEMYGGTDVEEALKASIAVELIQDYLLIVDDVMDRSAIRRGKPTIQYMYYDRLKGLDDQDDVTHIGNMLAVNAGLIAAHEAAELMLAIKAQPERVIEASRRFQANIKATGYGQINDLFSGIERTSEEDILLTHELKSGYYTFINPMQIGAILAGADTEDCELIERFGIPAGIAFQLQDDSIGMFGKQEESGKSNLDDLKEGKFTLVVQQALQRADKDNVAIVNQALGNQLVTEEEAAVVRKILIDCGAKDYADDMAHNFAQQAREVIVESNWPVEQQQFLDELMEYIVERIV